MVKEVEAPRACVKDVDAFPWLRVDWLFREFLLRYSERGCVGCRDKKTGPMGPVWTAKRLSLQQLEYLLRLRIGLAQNRQTGLLKDLGTGKLGGLGGKVGILNA